MKILVGNNHLQRTGGTENYTFALAVELQRLGHEVEYFAFERGEVAERLEDLGIHFMSQDSYDLILVNHNTVVERLCTYGFIIQTCHGVFPALEQPSPLADRHVSVTPEIKDHLDSLGVESRVLYNGIDCTRFAPYTPISPRLTTVLSLSQSDDLNRFLNRCCRKMNIKFLSCNKFTDNVWEIEKKINEADLVVGIGRSVYDAMACGRCVISFDCRGYMKMAIGDGYLNKDNFNTAIYHNCSGRGLRKIFTKKEFIQELKKYNPEDGVWAREYALENLNMAHSAKYYLSLFEEYYECQHDAEKALLQKTRLMSNILAGKLDVINSLQNDILRLAKKKRKYLNIIKIIGILLAVLLVFFFVMLFA